MTVIKRLLSTASAITLCTSLLLTAPAYANYAANNESAPEASVVCEDTSQRTAFSKHFLLDDGSYVAVSYPEAVHIKTDDGWEEIDNSLSADKNGTITNKNPAFPVAFNNTVSNSVSMGANDNRISWSLKAETKTSSVNADISRGITGNVISLINCTVSTNETTQRAAEYEIEACTNVNKNRKHDPVLKTYFSNPASDGSYLISEYYVRFLAKLHSETGYIPATNAYNAIIHEIEQIREALTTIVDSDIEIELNNRLNQLERIPNALAEINARAGYNIFQNNRIYFSDCNNLTYDEQCAILAMHSANVNYYSFAAEVLAHAAVLSTALPDSTYKCALIANMGLGEETDSGVLDQAYYNLNSPLVKDQVKYHENRYN